MVTRPLEKQCDNCGYFHHFQGNKGEPATGAFLNSDGNVQEPIDPETVSAGTEAQQTSEVATCKNTPRCPRCNFPIGYPRQPLLDENGLPLPLKTVAQIEAEEAAAKAAEDAAKNTAEQGNDDAPADTNGDGVIDDLEKKTKADLIPIADSLNVDGTKSMTKAQLIEAIRKAQAATAEQEPVNNDAERDGGVQHNGGSEPASGSGPDPVNGASE